MTQSLLDLEQKVENLQYLIQERGDGLVQQIYSSPHFLCLQMRFRGVTKYMYLGRGGTSQGMTMADVKVPSELRVQERFLQYARKNWRGMRLVGASLPVKDRLLELEGRVAGQTIKIWLFWQGRDFYFSDLLFWNGQYKLFQSWVGRSSHSEEVGKSLGVKEIFANVGIRELEEGIGRAGTLDIDSYFEKQMGKRQSQVIKKAQGKKVSKKLARMKDDLRKFDVLAYLEKQTSMDLTETKKIGEGRFSVEFIGLDGHFKKREYLFNKIKQWKKSRTGLLSRISAIESVVSNIETSVEKKRDLLVKQKVVQPVWKLQKEKGIVVSNVGYVHFSYKEFNCYIGRRATESDKIRKEIAKKDDLWLHLDGYKSGHLFVKSNKDPEIEDLIIMASALVDYSGLEINDIPIIFTQVKNLKGVKGVPGMVNYKKEKHLLLIYDDQWRQKITSIEDGT